jgi:hypothetical protein
MNLYLLAKELGLDCRDMMNVNFCGMGNYEDMDGELDFIKLKISNFQGKNNLKVYLEGEKNMDWIFFIVVAI